MRLLTLVVYVLLIFFLSSRPYLRSPGPDFHLKDKLVHTVEYFVLGLLLSTALGGMAVRSRAGTFFLLLALGVSVAAIDEVLQSYIPGRNMDVLDWLADTLGVIAGVGLCVATGMGMKKTRSGKAAGNQGEPA